MANSKKPRDLSCAISTKTVPAKLAEIMDNFNKSFSQEHKRGTSKYQIPELKIKIAGVPVMDKNGDILIIPPDPEKLDSVDSGNLTTIEFSIKSMPKAKILGTTKEANKAQMAKLAKLLRKKTS